MYKFNPGLPYALHESEQTNPLRLEILFREGDTFTPQTALFKCKDYFNDVVAAYHGFFGIVYGLNNANLKLNEDGVWVKLYNINNQNNVFVDNIEAVLQVELAESLDVFIQLEELDPTTFLLFLPRKMFDNTWTISLATYLIRLCNYGMNYTSLDDLMSKTHQFHEMNHFTPFVRKHKFNIPEGLKPYWFYCGEQYNSEKVKNISLVHNNGIANISFYSHQLKEKPCAAIAATMF